MKTKSLIFLLSAFILFACSKDENNGKDDDNDKDKKEELKVEFTAEVSGVSPNAIVEITNTTTGANIFNWEFSEGANIDSSTEQNPPALEVDKAGELTITLTAGDGDKEDSTTVKVTIEGTTAIVTYTDIEFALNPGDETFGSFFSFETGKLYKEDEIDETIGAIIHLAFSSMENTLYYFESPDADEYSIPNATTSKIVNWESEPRLSIDEFNTMDDDSILSTLSISHTREGFGNRSIPGIILFEISTGRKGAIQTKAVNAQRILVDIKIQKY